MGSAAGPNEGASFKVKNEYGSINMGVKGLVGDLWLPIYVDPVPMVTGTETFIPVVSLLVWFDRSLQTSTMFTEAVSMSVEVCLRTSYTLTSVLTYAQVDYTGKTTQTLSYVSGGGSGSGNGIWVTGDATSGLVFTPGKVYHPLSRRFEDLPFANDQRCIQSLTDKYFATPIGKLNKVAIQEWLVQAVVTYGANVVLTEVAAFINEHLPRTMQVSIEHGDRSLTVRIAWAALVKTKGLVRGDTDAEKLEEAFNAVINLYSPGYQGVNYTMLDSKPLSSSHMSTLNSDTTAYGEQSLYPRFSFD
jgi:hypothetical protein